MKKANLFLTILCMGSAITAPLYGISFGEFKTKLSGYKECILKKRPCTAQEKKTLGGVVATLITFAIALGAAFGYKWYQEQVATGWDGIQRLVEQFDADVRSQFPLGTIVRFDMSVLDTFKKAVPKLKKEELKKLQDNIDALAGPAGSLQKLITFVTQQGGVSYESLKDRFESTLANISKFVKAPENVYPYLGLKNRGKQMSATEVRGVINDKVNNFREIRETPQGQRLGWRVDYSEEKLNLLKRQLDYIFADEDQKKLFDAFLEGPSAVQQLPKRVTPQQQMEQMDKITQVISKLNDLPQ